MTRNATFSHTHLALAACLALLAACSRHEPPAAAAAPTPAATAPAPAATQTAAAAVDAAAPQPLDDKQADGIMRALFGDRYDAATHSARATVRDDGADRTVAMTFISAARLPDGRVVALVNGASADENGIETAGHSEPGILNVYMLRSAGGGWEVAERHENADTLGSEGHMGDARWVALGPGKPGFIMSSGGVWQGYAISFADVYALDGGVRHLGSFKEAGSNDGACGPDSGECWDIKSRLRIAPEAGHDGYRDILADFFGKRYSITTVKDDEVATHQQAAIRQTLRYRFDGKKYVPASDTNPVPDI
jgi:hypothetical protein